MTKVLITERHLHDIADAIRTKLNRTTPGVETPGEIVGELGSSSTYLPGEMAAAILSIEGGGGNLEALTARINGVYTPEAPVDGYDEVTVAVPTLSAEITQDAVELTGDAASVGEDAVVLTTRRLIVKTVTENGTYSPEDDNADAYSGVVVEVPGPTLIEKTVTEYGTYTAADDSADGYSRVTVRAGLGFTAEAAENSAYPFRVVASAFALSGLIWEAEAEEDVA